MAAIPKKHLLLRVDFQPHRSCLRLCGKECPVKLEAIMIEEVIGTAICALLSGQNIFTKLSPTLDIIGAISC